MIKYIITILLFVSFTASAQYIPNSGAYQYKGLKQTNSLQPPTASGLPVTLTNAPDSNYAAWYYRTADTSWYSFNPVTKTWSKFTGGGGSQIRDTAYLNAGWPLTIINPTSPDDSLYKPNGYDVTMMIDSNILGDYIVQIVNNDTSINNNSNDTARFIVDTIANSPPVGATDGYKVLVGAVSGNIVVANPTGLFTGHGEEVAELVGAVWNFTVPDNNDQLIVDNANNYSTWQYVNGVWRVTARLVRWSGDRGMGRNSFIGKIDKQPVFFRSWNRIGMQIDTTRKVYLPVWAGLQDSNMFYRPGVGGMIDTGYFRQLIAGTGITITPGLNRTDTISSEGGGTPAGNYGNIQINRNDVFSTPGSDTLRYIAGTLFNRGQTHLRTTTGTIGDSLLVSSAGIVKKVRSDYLTWQKTLDNGSTLDKSNDINGGYFNLNFDYNNTIAFRAKNSVDPGNVNSTMFLSQLAASMSAVDTVYASYISTWGDSVELYSVAPFTNPAPNQYTNKLTNTKDYFKFSKYALGGATGLNRTTKIIYENPDTLLTTPEFVYVSDNDTIKKYPFSGGGGSSLFPPTGTGTATGNVIGDYSGFNLSMNGSNTALGFDDAGGIISFTGNQIAFNGYPFGSDNLDFIANSTPYLRVYGSGDNGVTIQNDNGKSIVLNEDIGGIQLISNGIIGINNAYTLPTTDGSAGQVLTAHADNTATWETPSGGGLTGSTGDLISFSATNTQSNISPVAGGSVLVSNGTSAKPVYSANPSVTTLTTAGNLFVGDNIRGTFNSWLSSAGGYWLNAYPNPVLGVHNVSGGLGLMTGASDRIIVTSGGSVGINQASPAASAILDVTSTTQGFLPPRMTATQASAISSPAEGLLVYVTDTNGTFTAKGWWGYDGAAWQKLNN